MTTVTGLTAARMLAIEGASIVDGEVVGGNLILTKHDGSTINAGPVVGPQGATGPVGPPGLGAIPGEVRLWPGGALPSPASYGTWVWADGAVYAVASYPIAAGHIATQWRTFGGASDPGGANFRVPDLRGLTPVGMDAMPGGARANRMTRSVAITIAGRAGEETHLVTVGEMPSHGHAISDPGHVHSVNDPGHSHAVHNWSQHAGGNNTDIGASGTGDESANTYYVDGSGTGISINGSGTGIGVQANGGGNAHENVQPSVFVPYIVCMHG
jgi:microcystin-dependent protein